MEEGGAFHSLINLVSDTFDFLQHIMIPESENGKSLVAQPCIPFGVIVTLFRVLAAIEFDNDSLLQADKVDDVAPQRLLAAELAAFNLPHSDPMPKQLLCVRGVVAKRASAQSDSIHTPYPNLSPQGGKEPASRQIKMSR